MSVRMLADKVDSVVTLSIIAGALFAGAIVIPIIYVLSPGAHERYLENVLRPEVYVLHFLAFMFIMWHIDRRLNDIKKEMGGE